MTSVRFLHPWLLLILFLIPALIYLHKKYSRKATPAVDFFRLSTRSVVLALLVLALSGAQFAGKLDRTNIMFLVDTSDSVRTEDPEAVKGYIGSIIAAKNPNDT